MKSPFLAGSLFGIFFAVSISWSLGIIPGLVCGLLSGVFFGGAIYLFVNSRVIQAQISVSDEDLLQGERVVFFTDANLVIKLRDFALKDFAFDDLFWLAGMKGKESIGGRLHLTNFRLVFKSHRFNRVRGKLSIFLPTIEDITPSTLVIAKSVAVSTHAGRVHFVTDDAEALAKSAKCQALLLSGEAVARLKMLVAKSPEKCSGMDVWRPLNTMNDLVRTARSAGNVKGFLTNPIGTLASIFTSELIDESIPDRWRNRFE